MFVQCEGLVKVYRSRDSEMTALQGLDFAAEAGEMVALVGPSGAGKSTLLSILGAMDRPTAGRVRVGDWQLAGLRPQQQAHYRLQMVGFVWQDPTRSLLPWLSAEENVMVPMAVAGERDRHWARELLKAVGVGHRAHHRPGTLSGGEQQRVAVAAALANRPHLLLADEPTGSLDQAGAAELLAVLREVNRRYGTTVVLVTHDHAVARAMDRYVRIRDGRVAEEGIRAPQGGSGSSAESHATVTVVDGAGRLALPAAYLSAVGNTNRARAELEEGRIVVRPPDWS